MKTTVKLFLGMIIMGAVFTACDNEDDNKMQPEKGMYKVSIKNVMAEKMFFDAGIFNTPVGAVEPGGAGPGNSYQFTFHAGLGTKLSFATMYVKSNDLFYAPSGEGIELYEDNAPISGDITSQIMLYDAGTEVNEEPGAGANQPLNGGPGVGTAENGSVKEISMVNDGFTYPDVSSNIKVTISNDGGSDFTVTIENLAGSSTPIAPGVWVVHTSTDPLFTENMTDMGNGLKALAEDGDPATLASYLDMKSGYFSPLAPGVWAVHDAATVLFEDGSADFGEGLEALAEDGDPSGLATNLESKAMVKASGVFNTPTGAMNAGPLMPGNAYEFTIEAEEGDYLSFATMLVHSNDLFFAPGDMGVKISSGDITSTIYLWDAGTEVNEYPGAGIHQPARLNGGNDENSVVMMVNDGYAYPTVSQAIEVTITQL